MLSDDLLLDIFDYADLGMEQLLVVAKCCRRFEALVQRVYITKYDGNFQITLLDSTASISAVNHGLRVFGPFVQHFVLSTCSSELRLTQLWNYLDASQLKSLGIDFYYLCNMPRVGNRFDQLESLELYSQPGRRPGWVLNINFARCFPRLKSLSILTGHHAIKFTDNSIPRTLETLKINASIGDEMPLDHLEILLRANAQLSSFTADTSLSLTDEIVDLLHDCGLHRTLHILDLGLEPITTTNIFEFQQLRSLRMGFSTKIISDASLFVGLRHLESFDLINMWTENLDEMEFLMIFAANASPNMKTFTITSMRSLCASKRRAFEAAMPINCQCTFRAPSYSVFGGPPMEVHHRFQRE